MEALLAALLAAAPPTAGASPEETDALRAAYGTLLETPSGREAAGSFVAEGARAAVSFGAVSDGPAIAQGSLALGASGGYTDVAGEVPAVVLNRDYLGIDPAWRRSALAGTLAHELLGHALQTQRARRAGTAESYAHFQGNEENAALLGWLVAIEAGASPDDPRMLQYLRDPDGYRRELRSSMPFYAALFDRKELADLPAALQGRLRDLALAARELDEQERRVRRWRWILGDGLPGAAVTAAELDEAAESLPRRREALRRARERLEALSERWLSSPEERGRLSAQAGAAWYGTAEERLAALRARLSASAGTPAATARR